MNNINKTQTAVLTTPKRPVESGNININWNQNGSHKQSKSHVKRAATTVQPKEEAKHDKDKECRRRCETKNEEQGRDGNAYRNWNEE